MTLCSHRRLFPGHSLAHEQTLSLVEVSRRRWVKLGLLNQYFLISTEHLRDTLNKYDPVNQQSEMSVLHFLEWKIASFTAVWYKGEIVRI